MSENPRNADDSRNTLVSVKTSATGIECYIAPLLKVDVPPVIEDCKCFWKCPCFWMALILDICVALVLGSYIYAQPRVKICGIKWAGFYERSVTNPMHVLWWCFAVMCIMVIVLAICACHRHAMAKVLRDHSKNMVDAANGLVLNALKTLMSSGGTQKRNNHVSIMIIEQEKERSGNCVTSDSGKEEGDNPTTQDGSLSADH